MCRLNQFNCNFVKDKHILVILDLEILEEYGEQEKIGQPVALEAKVEGEEQKPQNINGNNFYGSKAQDQQQPQQQQQRSLTVRGGASGGGGAHGSIYPIEALSPYAHKWTIKARCTHKGDIKTWHNKNGEGKLFSVNLLDDSGEIRATLFKESVDQYYDILQEGTVYYISSPCKVQLAKKQFSNVNNDYELAFENGTLVEKAEDAEGVPQVKFSFTQLAELEKVANDGIIDCIGVLQNVDEVSEIMAKNSGKPYKKRELTIVDNTGYQARLTIWGKTADTFEAQPGEVVAFKGVKVSDFGGRSLSLGFSGTMAINPDIEESYTLKGWYQGSGHSETFQTHANAMSMTNATGGGDRNATKTIAQIKDEELGMREEVDWFSLKATIIYIKQDAPAYAACRTEGCNKKIVEVEVGVWRCEKCDVTWDYPKYRYIMSVNVSDHTGQIWLSCFDEAGELFMGVKANDLMALRDEGEDTKVAEIFNEANCKTYVFRCKGKMDSYNDTQRVRYQVQFAKQLDFAAESKKLADLIKQYDGESDSLFVS